MDHSEVKHFPKVDHTPAELDEASKGLLAAAELIERHGLAKGIRCDDAGRYCVIGAIGKAVYGDEEGIGGNDPVLVRLVNSLGMADWWLLAEWNNAAERKPQEVIAKLRAAAFGL